MSETAVEKAQRCEDARYMIGDLFLDDDGKLRPEVEAALGVGAGALFATVPALGTGGTGNVPAVTLQEWGGPHARTLTALLARIREIVSAPEAGADDFETARKAHELLDEWAAWERPKSGNRVDAIQVLERAATYVGAGGGPEGDLAVLRRLRTVLANPTLPIVLRNAVIRWRDNEWLAYAEAFEQLLDLLPKGEK